MAAVLSVSALQAFPFVDREPVKRSVLIGRAGGSSSRPHGSGPSKNTHKIDGYRTPGKYNPDAPGNFRAEANRIANDRSPYQYSPIPVYQDRPAPVGQTCIVKQPPSQPGQPWNVQGNTGTRSPDHLAHEMYRRDINPVIEEARWPQTSSKSKRENRQQTTGGLPRNYELRDPHGDQPKPKVVKDERQAAGDGLDPINPKKVGYPPRTTFMVEGREASLGDANYHKKLHKEARALGPDTTISHRANDPPGYQPRTRQPYRGPLVEGWHPPIDQREPDDKMYVQRRPDTRRRSDSPERSRSRGDGYSDQYNIRSRSPPRGGGYSGGRSGGYSGGYSGGSSRDYSGGYSSRKGKGKDRGKFRRDAVGAVGTQQSGAESTQNVEKTAPGFEAQYKEYLRAFNMVRINATEIVMPIIEEMVDGSNSRLVWDAAWEVMSIADPGIEVVGGLFSKGRHCIDWWEDQIVNQTHPEVMKSVYFINAVVEDLYLTAWDEAEAALEDAGLLSLMETLLEKLDTTDTSLTSIKADTAITERLNEFFWTGPYSTLAASNVTDDTLFDLNDSSENYNFTSAGNLTALSDPKAPDTATALGNVTTSATSTSASGSTAVSGLQGNLTALRGPKALDSAMALGNVTTSATSTSASGSTAVSGLQDTDEAEAGSATSQPSTEQNTSSGNVASNTNPES
ncbi:MAG: hypothetical protein Q9210_005917 [Variospora velana]